MVMRNTWGRPWKQALVQSSCQCECDGRGGHSRVVEPRQPLETHMLPLALSQIQPELLLSLSSLVHTLRLNIKNENSSGECAAQSPFNELQGQLRLMGPNTRLREISRVVGRRRSKRGTHWSLTLNFLLIYWSSSSDWYTCMCDGRVSFKPLSDVMPMSDSKVRE